MMIFVLRELVMEAPLIIVCMGGIVAACVFWQRASTASLCVVLACGFTLLLLVAYPVEYWCARALGSQAQGPVGAAFKIGWSVARSISTILLVVAAYAGRKDSHEKLGTV
jgi:hypothetical protein